MIQVVLPQHLRTLIGVSEPVEVEVSQPATIGAVLDALELGYPALRGTIRDHGAGPRRPFIRLFACGKDFSLLSYNHHLPDAVGTGAEAFFVVGAIAGG